MPACGRWRPLPAPLEDTFGHVVLHGDPILSLRPRHGQSLSLEPHDTDFDRTAQLLVCPHLHFAMRRFLLLLAVAALPMFSHAIEEPDYEVIRYSGTGSRSNYSEHLSELKAALYAPRREVMTGGRYGGFCPCISPRCSSSAGRAWAPPPDRLSTRQQRTTKSSGPRRSRVSS